MIIIIAKVAAMTTKIQIHTSRVSLSLGSELEGGGCVDWFSSISCVLVVSSSCLGEVVVSRSVYCRVQMSYINIMSNSSQRFVVFDRAHYLQTAISCSGRNLIHNIVECAVYYTVKNCLLYTSPSPRDATLSRMPSSA